MPSPVGHALGGAIVGLVCDRRGRSTGSALVRLRAALTSRLVIASAVAGALPDLDFLWGRHNMETHSLGAAVLAGIAVWLWRGGHGRIADSDRAGVVLARALRLARDPTTRRRSG